MTYRKILATGLLAIALTAQPAHAFLDGVYLGDGNGTDNSGAQHHELTRFVFKSDKLVSFTETITFDPAGFDGVACTFSPNDVTPPALGYAWQNYNGVGPNENFWVTMISFGCPGGSANYRAAVLAIGQQDGGKQFSYLDFTSAFAISVTNNLVIHFSGHAIKQ